MMAFMALLLPSLSWAQGTLTVADSTVSNEYVPFYGYYADENQHNQFIYPASMLTDMAGSNISEMVFYIDLNGDNGSNTTPSHIGTWTVSLGETTETTLTGLNTTTTLTQVYQGYFDCTTGTLTIPFGTLYAYAGGNLLVDITHSGAGYNAWYFLGIYSAGSAYSYGGGRDFLPKTTFTYLPAGASMCYRPQSFAVDSVSTDMVILSWSDTANTSASYTLQVINGTDTLTEYSVTSPYTVTLLQPNTPYLFRLAADCGMSSSSWVTIMGRTACGEATYPYTEGFEGLTTEQAPACWIPVNGDVYVRTGAPHSGLQYLDFRGTTSNTIALPRGTEPTSNLQVRFWTRPESSSYSSCGTFSVGYMTDLSNSNTFVELANWAYNTFTSGYEEKEVPMTGAPDSAYIVFRHNANTTYYYWYVDDVTVEPIPECTRPVTIVLDSVNPTSAFFTWTKGGDMATDYNIYYSTVNDIQNATVVNVMDSYDTVHYELENLTPNTTYYLWIRTGCSGDSSAIKYYGPFTTDVACSPLLGVQTGVISYTAAQIEWSYSGSVGNPSSGVEITLVDNTDSTIAPAVYNVTGTSYTFSGLVAGHSYTAYLRNYCSGDTDVDTASVNTIAFSTRSCSEVSYNGVLSNYAPFYAYYNYSYTQSVYTSAEMAPVDTIRGLSWYSNGSATKNIEVYVGYTNRNTLGTTAYVSADSLTLVAVDSMFSYTYGWNDIVFNTPFVYNPSQGNFVIAVRNMTGSYTSSHSWDHHTTANDQTVYWYQDPSAINMTSPSAQYSSTLSSVPAVRFMANCEVPDCFAPIVSVADVDSASITVSWESIGTESSWVVGIKETTGTAYNFVASAVADTHYTFTGLNSNTKYDIYVGSLCGSDTVASTLMQRTGCGYISTPYVEGFEDYATGEMPACWDRVQSGTSGVGTFPAVYVYANYTRTGSGYFELESSTGQTEIAALPLVDNISAKSLTFWASVTNTTGYSLEVGVMEGSTFVPVQTVPLVANSSYGSYSEYTVYFSNYAGSGERMAMRVNATGSYTIMIDDLSINDFAGCFPVTGLTASNIDSNAVTLAWDDTRNASASYTINYWSATGDTASAPLTTTDTYITLTGLNANAGYTFEVIADCGGSVPATPVQLNVRTACGSISIPFAEDFESLTPNSAPLCWNTINGNVRVLSSTYNAHGGSNYLNFSGSTNNAIALPRAGIPTNQLQVSFWTRSEGAGYSGSGTFSVGYMTDLNNDSSFVELANWAYNEFNNYELKEVPMVGAPDTAYIVLRHNAVYSYYNWLVDDLLVGPIPDCPHPATLTVTDATNDQISVSFTGSVSGNYIVYITDGTTTDSAAVVSDSVYTFTGLTALTGYTISVVSDCGTEVSDPISVATSTTAVAATTPYATTFEPGSDVAWQFSNGANAWVIDTAASNGGSHGLYISNDGGLNNMYTISSASASYAFRTIRIDTLGDYSCAYDWRAYGESNYDYLRVFLVPAAVTLTADQMNGIAVSGTPAGWIALDGGSQINQSSTWNSISEVFTVSAAGTYNLVFYWRNDGLVGTQPPAAIDNVQLRRLTCPAPQQLTLDASTTSSLSFSWIPSGSESQWEVVVDGVPTVVSTPAYTATGLASSSSHSIVVRALCGAGDTSFALTGTFSTGCDVVSVFPYFESFEQAEAPAPCWTLVYANNDPTVNPMTHTASVSYSGSPYDGSRAFRFSSYSEDLYDEYNQYLISPQLSGSDLILNFWYIKYGSYGDDDIQVGYSSTGTDITDFTWGPWLNTGSSDWQEFIDTMPAGTQYFAIHYFGDYAYYLYVDALSITGIGTTCAAPAITSVGTTDTSITVSFTGSASSYEVGIVAGNTWVAPSAPTAITTTSHTFSGLTAGTEYTLGIRSLCEEGASSDWTVRTLSTDDRPCIAPTNVTVSDVVFTGATIGWTPGELETAWQVNVSGPNFDSTYYTTANPLTIRDLVSNLAYTAKVRSYCSENLQSEWSAPANFTTASCQIPTNVAIAEGSITYHSAELTWTPAQEGGSGQYYVAYGVRGFQGDEGDSVIVTGTSYVIDGLNYETPYDAYVRTICADGIYSDWSPVVEFTTLVGIEGVENETVTLYPNPAHSMVTIGGVEEGATVVVVDLNGREVIRTTERTFDVSELAQGAYFVRITGDRTNVIRKLIVK